MRKTIIATIFAALITACSPGPDGTGTATCRYNDTDEPQMLSIDFHGDPELIYDLQGQCRCLGNGPPVVCEVEIDALKEMP